MIQLNDIALEKSIISSIINSYDLLSNPIDEASKLKEEYFSTNDHQVIVKEVKRCISNNILPDLPNVSLNIPDQMDNICDIVDTGSSTNITAHCEKLIELYNKRDLYSNLNRYMSNVDSKPSDTIKQDLMNYLIDSNVRDDFEPVHIRDHLWKTFDGMQNKVSNFLMPTGFKRLDDIIGGIGEGEIMTVGARPGNFKTSFLLNFIENNLDKKVLLFSLEMTTPQIIKRFFAMGGVDNSRIRHSKLKKTDYDKCGVTASKLDNSNIYIIETPGLTIEEICIISNRFIAKHPDTWLIGLDFIQRVANSKHFKTGDDTAANAHKSRTFTNFIKKVKCRGLQLSQLSRKCEERKDTRPIASDLSSSGKIEEDSHIIIFLWRGFKYNAKNHYGIPYKEDDISLLLEKSREGETGIIESKVEGKFLKFHDIDEYHNEEEPF